MKIEETQKTHQNVSEMNERLRKNAMSAIQSYGQKLVADFPEMSEGERTKWFFWNMHENLDEIRKLEPVLIGQIIRTQVTVSDGQSMWTEKYGLEKRVELSCKWQLLLKSDVDESEESYAINRGWIDLFVGECPPRHPVLQENQKGYLDSDSFLYPNQLFLYGWITEGVWNEIKPQLFNASSNCHTDIFLRDNFLFPVKPELDFFSGPTGSIGITNIEFRTSANPKMNTWVNK